MLVARLRLFKFNRKFTYFFYMHQRMGNGAGSTDFTNFFLMMISGTPYYLSESVHVTNATAPETVPARQLTVLLAP